MIDYARKSDILGWRSAGNPFAEFCAKRWGMAWIVENISLKPGMKVLDIGHLANRAVADFFFNQGCSFWAMDKLVAPHRRGHGCRDNDDITGYADELERRGGGFIDRYCGSGPLGKEYLGRFDLVFSLGVMEHTVEYGYPGSIFQLLAEMVGLLKPGGLLANIYEVHIFSDNPFNIRHDIQFLKGYVDITEQADLQASDVIPSLYQIATDPDTLVMPGRDTLVRHYKGKLSYTGFGYLGTKTKAMPLRKVYWHRNYSPNAVYSRYALSIGQIEELKGFFRIVFFGAGSHFRNSISYFKEFFDAGSLLAVADSDQAKWRQTQGGLIVIAPEEILDYKPDMVIITSIDFTEIVAWLEDLRENHDADFQIRILPSHA